MEGQFDSVVDIYRPMVCCVQGIYSSACRRLSSCLGPVGDAMARSSKLTSDLRADNSTRTLAHQSS